MSYYITSFDGTDLQATCGVVTPGVAGVHSLPPLRLATTRIPGASHPHISVLSKDFRQITFKAIVVGDDHDDLVSNLDNLRTYIRPDDDFHELVVADRAAQEIMALCAEGFEISTDFLPDDIDMVELSIPMLCYPYWQDSTPQSDTITSSPDSVTNDGDLECWPVYTATLIAAAAGGIWFQVGTDKFTWEDALNNGQVLVVTTDLPDITLDGSQDFSGMKTDSVFPGLGVGANTITLSDDSKFELGLSYDRRYK